MALARDEKTPASFDAALQQFRFCLIDGSTRLLGYVSVASMLEVAKRDRPDAALPPPAALFERYRDRIERAAIAEFEAGRAKTIRIRDALPFVWVRAFQAGADGRLAAILAIGRWQRRQSAKAGLVCASARREAT